MESRFSRGAYLLPFHGRAGERLAVAIDSRGRRAAEVPIYDDDDEPIILELLNQLLDRLDPTVRLKVLS